MQHRTIVVAATIGMFLLIIAFEQSAYAYYQPSSPQQAGFPSFSKLQDFYATNNITVATAQDARDVQDILNQGGFSFGRLTSH